MEIDYTKYLKEFHDLYERRPIDDNEGGMKSPHLFATFNLLRKLKPERTGHMANETSVASS